MLIPADTGLSIQHKGGGASSIHRNIDLLRPDGTGTGSEVTADAAGVIEVPRDVFLDQSADPVQSVTLRAVSMASPADAWFGVPLAVPPA